MESVYDDPDLVAAQVRAGQHRGVIGGLWDEMGLLQFEFMRARGLRPGHRLLDLGCGALRGGVHFARYLEPGRYHGHDNNQSLLDAGYEIELANAGLQARVPRGNLSCSADFSLPVDDDWFDFGIAQSLFTHLSFNSIRRCLETVAPKFRVGGVLFATYFELPEGAPASAPHAQARGGIVTCGHEDPYHYRRGDLVQAAAGAPWAVQWIGEWGHPRGQLMMAFERKA
jgi:SAM-dependent methyltransferase